MKHRKIQIAFLALVFVFGIGQSIAANESESSSKSNSASSTKNDASKKKDDKNDKKGKKGHGGHGGNGGHGNNKQCKLPNGKKGIRCKTGECVKSANKCPHKPPSPH